MLTIRQNPPIIIKLLDMIFSKYNVAFSWKANKATKSSPEELALSSSMFNKLGLKRVEEKSSKNNP